MESRYKALRFVEKRELSENSIKIIDGEKTQAPDHSILVAFAPKENPKIALLFLLKMGGMVLQSQHRFQVYY